MLGPVKTILITGATGKQGGAVVDALLSSKSHASLRLLAVTRNAASDKAKELTSKGVTLVEGDPALDPVALFQKSGRVDAVFLVTIPTPSRPTQEETQAAAFIATAIAAGVRHLVFSSVDRGGPAASAETPTPVPHFASKQKVELQLRAQAAKSPQEMTWTILRPTTFYDNLTPDTNGKGFASMWRGLAGKKMQLVACKDVGVFAARALERPAEYAGRSISLAGDEIGFAEAARTFETVIGGRLPVAPGFVGVLLKLMVGDLGAMFRWFATDGYGADIEELRKEHPGLLSFKAWLDEQSRFRRRFWS